MWPFKKEPATPAISPEEIEKDAHRLVLIRAEIQDIRQKYKLLGSETWQNMWFLFHDIDEKLEKIIKAAANRVAQS